MQEPPRPGRRRGRRRPPRTGPTRAPAEPQVPRELAKPERPRPAGPRPERARPDRARGPRGRPPGPRAPERPRGAAPRGRGRGRPRQAPEERVGTAALILLDNREGEPDLTGQPAVFEGYFDLETGDRRRPGEGVPRLRAGAERLWGFECWWRPDPTGAGLTTEDHELLEASKKLLRSLLRDARRSGRPRPQ